MPINPVSAQKVLSDTPFLDPSSARPTGPVWLPAGAEDDKGSDNKLEKKNSRRSKHKSDKKSDKKSHRHSGRHSDKSTHWTRDKSELNPQSSTDSTQAGTDYTPGTGFTAMLFKLPLSQSAVQPVGQPVKEVSTTGPTPSFSQASATPSSYGTTGPEDYPSVYSELPYEPEDSDHYSGSEPDEGELSETGEKQEVT